MALVKCSECAREISDKAATCPGCGASVATKKKKSFQVSGLTVGCGVVLLGVMFMSWCTGSLVQDSNISSTPRQEDATPRTPSANHTLRLSDGSMLSVQNYRRVDPWACGQRATGRISVPERGGSLDVVVYFDQGWNLFSIDVPAAGNERLYDESGGRECLMNWKTEQMELLTGAEYSRYEKESGAALPDSLPALVKQEPPPPPVDPVRVGGDIRPPNKIKDITPKYPDIAKQARVKGLVILEAIIDPSGTVTSVRVLRSIPLLDQSAIDAVMQWKYELTLLDGAPVPIVMTVTVTFP